MGILGGLSSPTKLQTSQIEIRNPINQWSVCQFSECQSLLYSTNVKPLYWRLFGDGSVWAVDWNICQSIESYIKQPFSFLGFNAAQSWKFSLWPGCGKWNGQRNIVCLFDHASPAWAVLDIAETMILLKCSEMSKITRLLPQNWYGGSRKADHYDQCDPPRFARKLCFDSLSFFQNTVYQMYALSYSVECNPDE